MSAQPSNGAQRVLVVGDANPDLVLRGDVVPRFGQAEQLLESAELVLGGSAAINAHGLARLGRPVTLLAAVGPDLFGDRVLAQLAAAGVDTGCVQRRTGVATGLTVVLSTGGESERAILTLPGAIPTLTATEVQAAYDVPGVAHVHVASLYLQPQLLGELADLLALARRRGLSTSLDTNDDPAGTWLGLDVLLPHLDLLLPNRAEVCALARQADPRDAATALAARGPTVVVKDGARGAFAVSPAGLLEEVAAAPCRPVDSTGAGDTFDAAYVDAWLAGRDPTDCLRRAVLAGARAVTAIGGTAGQPTQHDLDLDRSSTPDERSTT